MRLPRRRASLGNHSLLDCACMHRMYSRVHSPNQVHCPFHVVLAECQDDKHYLQKENDLYFAAVFLQNTKCKIHTPPPPPPPPKNSLLIATPHDVFLVNFAHDGALNHNVVRRKLAIYDCVVLHYLCMYRIRSKYPSLETNCFARGIQK